MQRPAEFLAHKPPRGSIARRALRGPVRGISGPLKVSRPGSRAKKNASRNSPKGKLRKA